MLKLRQVDMKIFFLEFLEELVHVPVNWENRIFSNPLKGEGEVEVEAAYRKCKAS